ncbi:MAG: HypC/HybG/HupF family hydrogenase formation chaperone [Bacteroidetes bacterium]|nr:HypC/HybG/HupF family hydrogenase formation chaperone [Bacteroidota bacterium]
MCLSIPGKVLAIRGDKADVSIQGNLVEVSLQLVEDVKVNDYVLVHVGFALEKINDSEATEMLKVLKELKNFT